MPTATSHGAEAPCLVALIEQFFFHEGKNTCNSEKRVWLIGYQENTSKLAVLHPDCGQWSCPHCAEVLAKRWILRTMLLVEQSSDPKAFDFVTLTLHEKLQNFEQTSAVFSDAWTRLYAALRRIDKQFSYVLVPELHKSGRIHAHMITNFPVPDEYNVKRKKRQNTTVKRMREKGTMDKFWKDVPRAYGWGYANDQEHLEGDTVKVAGYLAKYLGKQRKVNNWQRGFRHVRASHDVPALPDEENHLEGFTWEVIPDQQLLAAKLQMMIDAGYHWLDTQTGEMLL
jgi:hypothetical protein